MLPDKPDTWRKNKPGKTKHTFDDAIPFNQRKKKATFSSKNKEEPKEGSKKTSVSKFKYKKKRKR